MKFRHSSVASAMGVVLLTGSFVVLLTGYFAETARERGKLAPASRNFADFAASMPEPKKLCIVNDSGQELIVWVGNLSGPIDVPSGPSCYVFQINGRLLNWTPDTGEGGPLDRFARMAWEKPPSSIDEIKDVVARASQ